MALNFTLSAFADEADPNFDAQLAALARNRIPLLEIRGVDGKPFTMGGGTYARHFKNAISFGTEIPAEPLPDFVGKIHTFDEGIGIDRLKMSLKIYILALYRLMQIEF